MKKAHRNEIKDLKKELAELKEWKKQFADIGIMVKLHDKEGVEPPTTHLIHSESKLKDVLKRLLLEIEEEKHKKDI